MSTCPDRLGPPSCSWFSGPPCGGKTPLPISLRRLSGIRPKSTAFTCCAGTYSSFPWLPDLSLGCGCPCFGVLGVAPVSPTCSEKFWYSRIGLGFLEFGGLGLSLLFFLSNVLISSRPSRKVPTAPGSRMKWLCSKAPSWTCLEKASRPSDGLCNLFYVLMVSCLDDAIARSDGKVVLA